MALELPAPLVPADVDVRDLDGFMLNVERLMASELVALSSHEIVAAALFLWCRAWKQSPAASLPDDDRVIAAFARLSPARYQKLKQEILRGFVKCSDGRLYHKVLATEAIAANTKKQAFRERREKDAERLRQWRLKQGQDGDGNSNETIHETTDETCFVREGQGQGQGQVRDRDTKNKNAGPPLCDGMGDDQPPPEPAEVIPTQQAELFRRGKDILGKSAGGLIRNLLTAKDDNVALARAAIETASTRENPREYLGAIIAGRERNSAQQTARDRGDAW